MRSMTTLLLVLALAFVQPAFAEELSPEVRLTLLLSGWHTRPEHHELEGLELDDLQSALISIAEDKDALQLPRGRAIEALDAYPDARTRAFLERFLEDSTVPFYLTARALELTARMGESEPTWALARIAPFARHSDPVLRQHVVLGLGHMRTHASDPEIDELLLQIALAERHRAVRKSLDIVLERDPELRPLSTPPIHKER